MWALPITIVTLYCIEHYLQTTHVLDLLRFKLSSTLHVSEECLCVEVKIGSESWAKNKLPAIQYLRLWQWWISIVLMQETNTILLFAKSNVMTMLFTLAQHYCMHSWLQYVFSVAVWIYLFVVILLNIKTKNILKAVTKLAWQFYCYL